MKFETLHAGEGTFEYTLNSRRLGRKWEGVPELKRTLQDTLRQARFSSFYVYPQMWLPDPAVTATAVAQVNKETTESQ